MGRLSKRILLKPRQNPIALETMGLDAYGFTI